MAELKNSITCRANGALTQYQLVKLGASAAGDGIPDAAPAAAGTDFAVGVALSSVADNGIVEVQVCGVATAVAGEALTLGTAHSLASNASGQAVAAAANDFSFGVFLGSLKGTATAASGDHILVALAQSRYEVA